MSGNGIMIHPDGSKYKGEFGENFYHGKGTLTSINGELYYGNFEKGNKTDGKI